MSTPKPVTDKESAKKFLDWCCRDIGMGFHPDTDFADYVSDSGSRVFTNADSVSLNRMLHECFRLMEDDIYDYCMNQPPFCEGKPCE